MERKKERVDGKKRKKVEVAGVGEDVAKTGKNSK